MSKGVLSAEGQPLAPGESAFDGLTYQNRLVDGLRTGRVQERDLVNGVSALREQVLREIGTESSSSATETTIELPEAVREQIRLLIGATYELTVLACDVATGEKRISAFEG